MDHKSEGTDAPQLRQFQFTEIHDPFVNFACPDCVLPTLAYVNRRKGREQRKKGHGHRITYSALIEAHFLEMHVGHSLTRKLQDQSPTKAETSSVLFGLGSSRHAALELQVDIEAFEDSLKKRWPTG